MLKQTTLMQTTTNYTNNKTTQNKQTTANKPALSATQPQQLAPAPLGRGAYGVTFGVKTPGIPNGLSVEAQEALQAALACYQEGLYAEAKLALQGVPNNEQQDELIVWLRNQINNSGNN